MWEIGTKRKINVLYITYTLDIGGLEKLVLELAKKLDKNIFVPRVCTFSEGGRLQVEFENLAIPVHVFKIKDGIDCSIPFKLARLFKKEQIDIVHTHNATPWLYSSLASILCGKVKLVHTEHSNINPVKKALMIAERLLAARSGCVVADAKHVARFMIERVKIGENKLKVVYNGINTIKFVLPENNNSPVKKIGIIARLVPVKDHATLLKAFRIISQEVNNVELWIIGDGELKANLEGLAADMGLNQRVRFMGARNDIPQLMKQLHVFVLSSISEGLPIVLLEAMAAALPVVVTDVGGNPEVVVHDETGLLVPPNAPDKLAQAVLSLLKDSEKAIKMGEQGRERVEKLFTLEKMTTEYETIYKGLFDKGLS